MGVDTVELHEYSVTHSGSGVHLLHLTASKYLHLVHW
ncbi:uncharacterized protein METZ01_LOCUS90716 [marine metagenome]|uniref:Uncharacterized protein n=1 Tax=marine metagenome TaxID=408172 RepID=A0A381VBW4_9ZZZZ